MNKLTLLSILFASALAYAVEGADYRLYCPAATENGKLAKAVAEDGVLSCTYGSGITKVKTETQVPCSATYLCFEYESGAVLLEAKCK